MKGVSLCQPTSFQLPMRRKPTTTSKASNKLSFSCCASWKKADVPARKRAGFPRRMSTSTLQQEPRNSRSNPAFLFCAKLPLPHHKKRGTVRAFAPAAPRHPRPRNSAFRIPHYSLTSSSSPAFRRCRSLPAARRHQPARSPNPPCRSYWRRSPEPGSIRRFRPESTQSAEYPCAYASAQLPPGRWA